jgi:biopolymer transport protein ExbB/TolQ
MRKEKGKTFALWGAWLQLAALIGSSATAVLMVEAFQKISSNEPTSAGPLANEVSISLFATLIGMIPVFMGVILMAVALFGKNIELHGSFGS